MYVEVRYKKVDTNQVAVKYDKISKCLTLVLCKL